MSDIIQFEYDREKLIQLAHSHGYATIQAYIESLIDDEEPEPDLGESLREALIEIKEGRAKLFTSIEDILNEPD